MRTPLVAAITAALLVLSSAAIAQEDAPRTVAGVDWPEGAAPPPEPTRPPIMLTPFQMPAGPSYDEAPPPKPRRYVQRHVGFEVGARTQLVLLQGLDPYSRSDLLPAFSVAATWVPLRAGALSLALTGEYDIGGQSANARGDETSLTMHRFAGAVQARFALAPRLYAFVKGAPAALHLRASIDDAGLDRPLYARTWTWNVDVTGGAAILLGAAGDDDWPAARFWLVGELGYAFAGRADMRFSPAAEEDDPRQFGELEMPGLRLAGAVQRFAFGVTF